MSSCPRLWRLDSSHSHQLWADVDFKVASAEAAQAMAAWLRARVDAVVSLRVSLPLKQRGDDALSAEAAALPAALAGGPLVRLDWRCGWLSALPRLLLAFSCLEEATLQETWDEQVSLFSGREFSGRAGTPLAPLRRLVLLSGTVRRDPLWDLGSLSGRSRHRREYPGQPFRIVLKNLGIPAGLEVLHLEGWDWDWYLDEEAPFQLSRAQGLRRLHIKATADDLSLHGEAGWRCAWPAHALRAEGCRPAWRTLWR